MEIIPRWLSSSREPLWASLATIIASTIIGFVQNSVISIRTSLSKEKTYASPIQIIATTVLVPLVLINATYISISQYVIPQFMFPHLTIVNHLNRNFTVTVATILQFVCIAIASNKSLNANVHISVPIEMVLDSMKFIPLKGAEDEGDEQGQL